MVDKGKYWSKRKADGYCACCSAKALPGLTRCASCRANDAIDQRRTYHHRREAQQCVRCWREAEPRRSRCGIHLEKARAQARRRREGAQERKIADQLALL